MVRFFQRGKCSAAHVCIYRHAAAASSLIASVAIGQMEALTFSLVGLLGLRRHQAMVAGLQAAARPAFQIWDA